MGGTIKNLTINLKPRDFYIFAHSYGTRECPTRFKDESRCISLIGNVYEKIGTQLETILNYAKHAKNKATVNATIYYERKDEEEDLFIFPEELIQTILNATLSYNEYFNDEETLESVNFCSFTRANGYSCKYFKINIKSRVARRFPKAKRTEPRIVLDIIGAIK